VNLYGRGMAPSERCPVTISLVASVPGRFTGPAPCGYLYYTDEQKDWAEPLAVTVHPRN
jgi:hypothetical protein